MTMWCYLMKCTIVYNKFRITILKFFSFSAPSLPKWCHVRSEKAFKEKFPYLQNLGKTPFSLCFECTLEWPSYRIPVQLWRTTYLYGYPWYFDLNTDRSRLKKMATNPSPTIDKTVKKEEAISKYKGKQFIKHNQKLLASKTILLSVFWMPFLVT